MCEWPTGAFPNRSGSATTPSAGLSRRWMRGSENRSPRAVPTRSDLRRTHLIVHNERGQGPSTIHRHRRNFLISFILSLGAVRSAHRSGGDAAPRGDCSQWPHSLRSAGLRCLRTSTTVQRIPVPKEGINEGTSRLARLGEVIGSGWRGSDRWPRVEYEGGPLSTGPRVHGSRESTDLPLGRLGSRSDLHI